MHFRPKLRLGARRMVGSALVLALLMTCLPAFSRTVSGNAYVPRSDKPASTDGKSGLSSAENSLAKKRISENYGHLPLSFEINKGQLDQEVKFFSRGSGIGLYLTRDEMVMVLKKNAPSPSERVNERPDRTRAPSEVVRMKLLGASRRPTVVGLEELPGKSNYFIGNDPTKWQTDVLNYAKVKYLNVYPGVDAVYYGNAGQLEYDFIVAPGANPKSIKLSFEGAQKLSLDANGDLVLAIDGGEIRQHKPIVYQDLENGRRQVDCRYVISGKRQVRFELDQFDRTKPLIIDPILAYSTFLGGSNDEFGEDVAVDSSGNAYVTGYTLSTNFPRLNAFQNTHAGSYDMFVTKFNSTGSNFIYSTYIGGSALDWDNSITVDSSGAAYITGGSSSTNFPMMNAFDSTKGTGEDAVLAKLSVTGSLQYSTYLGGDSQDKATTVAVDANGAMYVAGFTYSSNFPTTAGAFRTTFVGGTCGDDPCSDAFVTKFNAAGSSLVYSTYLGGGSEEAALGITLDTVGNAYLAGYTNSSNFPTLNPIQGAWDGGWDVFVTGLNTTGSSLLFSTYLGGQADDYPAGIARDPDGNLYVAGSTASTDFPIANAFQSSLAGNNDAFLFKLNSAGTALIYSTYLGGTSTEGTERATGVTVDSSGNAYVAGFAESSNFPLVDALDLTLDATEVFVTKFNAAGSALLFSTFMGGSHWDRASGIALGPNNEIYVFGDTFSLNFPTAVPKQPTNAGGHLELWPQDAFLFKISNETGHSISGVITDAGGNPIPGVFVWLTGRQNQTTLTNASGSYAFPNLATGNYTVAPVKANHTFAPNNQTFNNLTADQIANFTGTVAQVTLSGKIVDAFGTGVSGVTVSLTGTQTGSQVTTIAGTYTFTNLNAGGNYTVTPSRATDTFVPANKSFTNLSSDQSQDFTLVYKIEGQVTDSLGAPASDITVSLSGHQTSSVLTNGTGNFSFVNLPANASYTVTPSKPGYTLNYNFTPLSQTFGTLNANSVANFSFTTSTNVTLFPIADAHVHDGSGANTNFGTVTPMLVKTANQADQRRDVYLKFDLSTVSRQITNAKLLIYAALSAAGSVGTAAYSVTDTNWQEGTITWANKPQRNSSAIPGSTATVTSTTFATYSLDITSYILEEKNAGRNIISFAVHNPSNSTPHILVNSRESGTDKPQLLITTSSNNNAAPAVSLTSPTNGAAYTTPINVPFSASASDSDGSISKVDYYAGTSLIGTATVGPYNFTWPNVPIGSYSLTAVATDNQGLSNTSSPVQIVVKEPNVFPSVSLTSPSNNTAFPVGSNISLAANASDQDGSVTQVQFFAGSTLLGTATTAPYTFAWNNVAAGAYSLTAQATDNSGAVRISDPVNIKVVWQTGVSAVADAYVRDGSSASTNFGTQVELQTQQGAAGSNRESYLRFDLTAVNGVANAKLRVFGRLSDTSGSNVPVGVYSVASTTWIESGASSITWNNKPVTGGTILSTATVTDNVPRWYEFDVSAYIQSEKQANRHIVSFAMKSLASSSPFTIFNSKEAATNRPQLVVWTTQTRNALFAVGSSNLSPADSAIKTRLENLGFTVTVEVANNGLTTSDADGKAVIVVSSTVNANNVGDKFKFVPVPVVNWEFDVLDNFGMTGGSSGTDFGTTSTTQTQLGITNATHPMAAGLSGTVAVATTATNFTWGNPNVNALKIASVVSDPAKSVIFGYERDATMPGLAAPARRVALFMTDLTPNSFNANGQALFDAAVKWAIELTTAPTIITLTPNAGPIGATFTINGSNFGLSQGISTVTLNGVLVNPSSWGNNTITALVPTYATTGAVVITVNGITSNGAVFTVGDLDSDADGLSDWWEIQYFGNLNQTASGDPDGDAMTNLQEFQQGRNPTVHALIDDAAINLKVYTPLAPLTP